MAAIAESVLPTETALPVCLWKENPYGLVSWWDVEQFSGNDLLAAIRTLDSIRYDWANAQPQGDAIAARLLGQQRAVEFQDKQRINLALSRVEKHIRDSGLPTSAEAIAELRAFIGAGRHPDSQLTSLDIVSQIDSVKNTIRLEMKAVLFLYIPSDHAKRYRVPLDGWEKATNRWPEIIPDISESSKCFALDRFGAATFHILLAAEFGTIQACKLFGVEGDRPGWGCAERLERIHNTPYKDRSAFEQNYSTLLKDVVQLIPFFKNARHQISHIDNKVARDIGPHTASEIIGTTRGFLRTLAEGLPVVP
jgi:hypothetical protein